VAGRTETTVDYVAQVCFQMPVGDPRSDYLLVKRVGSSSKVWFALKQEPPASPDVGD